MSSTRRPRKPPLDHAEEEVPDPPKEGSRAARLPARLRDVIEVEHPHASGPPAQRESASAERGNRTRRSNRSRVVEAEQVEQHGVEGSSVRCAGEDDKAGIDAMRPGPGDVAAGVVVRLEDRDVVVPRQEMCSGQAGDPGPTIAIFNALPQRPAPRRAEPSLRQGRSSRGAPGRRGGHPLRAWPRRRPGHRPQFQRATAATPRR